jgi:hypothetical protein
MPPRVKGLAGRLALSIRLALTDSRKVVQEILSIPGSDLLRKVPAGGLVNVMNQSSSWIGLVPFGSMLPFRF